MQWLGPELEDLSYSNMIDGRLVKDEMGRNWIVRWGGIELAALLRGYIYQDIFCYMRSYNQLLAPSETDLQIDWSSSAESPAKV